MNPDAVFDQAYALASRVIVEHLPLVLWNLACGSVAFLMLVAFTLWFFLEAVSTVGPIAITGWAAYKYAGWKGVAWIGLVWILSIRLAASLATP
jgi:hypothetical protein